MKKIVRSVCLFNSRIDHAVPEKLNVLEEDLCGIGFTVQSKRFCTSEKSLKDLSRIFDTTPLYFCAGALNRGEAREQFDDFIESEKACFHLDLTDMVKMEDVRFLFDIIKRRPEKTFTFAYTFNNVPSSPFFPSSVYHRDGFSIGLQPTDLSEECGTVDEWLQKLQQTWEEIAHLFRKREDFIGIDSSIAPLYDGTGSFIHFIKKAAMPFSRSVSTPIYLRISDFIKRQNPKPAGLCGLMFPCLEDFELAEEYEKGNFPIERNVYLSLHCGLGIDTYPIGTDEKPERILEVLRLVQGLSARYQKPLSVRFVSDGKAKIGDKTSFGNQFLKDVVVRAL